MSDEALEQIERYIETSSPQSTASTHAGSREDDCQRWNDDATTSNGERAFWPTWGSVSSDSGTANIVNDSRWQDTGELGGYGGPVTMAAIDAGEVTLANARPVDGETWWRGVEHLRKLGFDIPKYEIREEDRKCSL